MSGITARPPSPSDPMSAAVSKLAIAGKSPNHAPSTPLLTCPVCNKAISRDERQLNTHIDECLTMNALESERTAPAAPAPAVHVSSPVPSHAAASLTASPPVHSTSHSNDLTVTCPHPACRREFVARLWPQHYITAHANPNTPPGSPVPPPSLAIFHPPSNVQQHAFVCPLCTMTGASAGYVPNADTNLYAHLHRQHPEMLLPTAFLNVRPLPAVPVPSHLNSSNSMSPAPSSPLSSSPARPSSLAGVSQHHHHHHHPSYSSHPPGTTAAAAASSSSSSSLSAPPSGPSFVLETLDHSLPAECSICLETLDRGQQIARLECWDVFHVKCISDWWRRSKTCPLHMPP